MFTLEGSIREKKTHEIEKTRMREHINLTGWNDGALSVQTTSMEGNNDVFPPPRSSHHPGHIQ